MFDHNRKINHEQKCLTAVQYKQLVKNFQNREGKPVVKFFNPRGAATWLISELDPETGIAFGLADLGFDCPEIGYVDLNELADIGHIERDLYFNHKDKTLQEWLTIAEKSGLAGV